MESRYHLESLNFLKQTNKPVISLLIKLYWQQPLLKPWHSFEKMKLCRKYVLNTGNALQRKDCVIHTNKCTTFFPFFSILYLKVIDADLKPFLYVRVYIKV